MIHFLFLFTYLIHPPSRTQNREGEWLKHIGKKKKERRIVVERFFFFFTYCMASSVTINHAYPIHWTNRNQENRKENYTILLDKGNNDSFVLRIILSWSFSFFFFFVYFIHQYFSWYCVSLHFYISKLSCFHSVILVPDVSTFYHAFHDERTLFLLQLLHIFPGREQSIILFTVARTLFAFSSYTKIYFLTI